MYALLMLIASFILLAMFLILGFLWGQDIESLKAAARCFIPIWLLLTLSNTFMGIYYAGYRLKEELPILITTLITPVALASMLIYVLSRLG